MRIVEQVVEGFKETGAPARWSCSPLTSSSSPAARSPGGQEYHGHEGLLRGFGEFAEAWQSIEPEILELLEGDDIVVAVGASGSRRIAAWSSRSRRAGRTG